MAWKKSNGLKKADTRVSVTEQLTPGRDDDLIAAIQSLPVGSKNATLREWLRVGMRAQQGMAPLTEQVYQMRGELSGMASWLSRVLDEKLARVVLQTSNLPAPVQRADDEVLRRRADNILSQTDW